MSGTLQQAVYWQLAGSRQERRRLDRDCHADTVVVGGGMAGLMCAARLAAAGQSVVLLERSTCAGGASGRSSGFIAPDSELELSQLVDRFGVDEARRLWEMVNGGVDLIRQTVNRLQICCALHPQDSLFIANRPSGKQDVEQEDAARTQLGYASRLYQRDQLAAVIGSDQYYGAIRYGDTFAINPFLFCRAVADALETQGVAIYENTEVTAIEPACVHVGSYRVRAPRIAVCTDYSVPAGLPVPAGSIRPIQTFIALTRPLADVEVERLFPDGLQMVWDTDLIYQYFRIADENRLLIGAGSLRSTYARREAATPPHVLRKMRRYLRQKFPWLSADLEFTWPGRIGVTRDFMPISDCESSSADVYTVLAATGLPWAAALGQQIAEHVLNVADRNDGMFSSTRAFPWPSKLQWAIGQSAAFALSHLSIKK